VTDKDVDHGATTVQLMPYDDTPNPGGEYKVWVTYKEDFIAGCALLGFAGDPLEAVSCGPKSKGNAHGFLPRHSKTDNFKVRGSIREIDTIFHAPDGTPIDGLGITWTDTLGASNNKWSYENLALNVHHEAHVESVEDGFHTITIENQPGCTVGAVYADGVLQKKSGPQSIIVNANGNWRTDTFFIDVYCQ